MAVAEPALIAVVGPTASGKSALGLELATRHGGEIVSCDSLQVYRGLDIGSAKPGAADRARVRHHLLDVADPDSDFSAAEYSRLARAAVRDIAARGRVPVVVGGTGLYLRALLTGLFVGPSRDAAVRARLERLAERFGRARLHRLLAGVDPVAAARIEPNDSVRVVRALEVYRATRRPISEHFSSAPDPLRGFRVRVVGLALAREELRARVEARTDAMLAGGLVEEVRGLVARYGAGLRPLRAIGYRQALGILRGELDVAAARRGIVTDTMQYAKRQRTWFRHQADVTWFASAALAGAELDAWLA